VEIKDEGDQIEFRMKLREAEIKYKDLNKLNK